MSKLNLKTQKLNLKTQKLNLKMLKLNGEIEKLLYMANFTPVRSLDGLSLQSSTEILQNVGIHSKIVFEFSQNYNKSD